MAEKNFGKPQVAKPAHVVHKPVSKLTGKESKDFRGIVRILGRDLDGHLPVRRALRRLKGVGHNLAAVLSRAVEKQLGISPDFMVGELSDKQLGDIEVVIKDPTKVGIKIFQVNRNKDNATGKPVHLLATDLVFTWKQDFGDERDMRSWRAWRLSLGQRVRGQHTRTTGRSGMTVGVLKKAIKAQKAAAATAAQEQPKK